MHTSCTIEMVNLSKRYDVAVIDEIQVRGCISPAGAARQEERAGARRSGGWDAGRVRGRAGADGALR